MAPSDAFDLLRSELSDQDEPHFWTDDELFAYLDDAQKMFCRLTDGISDASTAAITRLTVPVNADWLVLSPLILKIRSAFLVSTGKPIEVLNQEGMDERFLRFDGRKGPVSRLIEGMEENRARVHPIASIADAIQLTVFRLPKDAVNDSTTFEIGEQHHLHLLKWAKHLAYGKNDADTRDEKLAEKFERQFRAYCEMAKHEQQNKRHRVRTVSYGGI